MPVLVIFTLIVAVTVIVVRKHIKERQLVETVSERGRGERSERRTVLALLKMGINPRAIFHDCYIRRSTGRYTQIDLVVATKNGLIVIEDKEYSGWIFGNSRQKYWTQILAYGKEKHRFYNPIMQNRGHVNAIRENLPQNLGVPIYSVIIFYGSSEFKNVTVEEDNVFIIYPESLKKTIDHILHMPEANFGNKHEIMNLFIQAVKNGNNPEIISAQIHTASQAAYNKPNSTYIYNYNPFRNFRRRRYW